MGRRPRRDAHTVLAAGGINAALASRDPEDERRARVPVPEHVVDWAVEDAPSTQGHLLE